jgi:hypothetical protein
MGRRALIATLLVLAAGAAVWHYGLSPEERQIRKRLRGFAAEFNDGASDGLGLIARAARLGSYFTPDIVLELGGGSPPIQGRETLIGMATRLQPRTAAFVMELDDVNVERIEGSHAEVVLTVLIRRKSFASGEESIDAREFAVRLRKEDGQWRMNHVAAVDTLR